MNGQNVLKVGVWIYATLFCVTGIWGMAFGWEFAHGHVRIDLTDVLAVFAMLLVGMVALLIITREAPESFPAKKKWEH